MGVAQRHTAEVAERGERLWAAERGVLRVVVRAVLGESRRLGRGIVASCKRRGKHIRSRCLAMN
jgi:hypothetical protein